MRVLIAVAKQMTRFLKKIKPIAASPAPMATLMAMVADTVAAATGK